MIVRDCCTATTVASGGSGSSSRVQPSSAASRASRRYRLPGLNVAPQRLRPRSLGEVAHALDRGVGRCLHGTAGIERSFDCTASATGRHPDRAGSIRYHVPAHRTPA
jgi:hypothetical protein